MKQKAKNAFKHKVELFGKTVPTMLLIGLFLAGSGSAALLTTFGTVSGTADVDQAVTLTGSSDYDVSAVGGEMAQHSFYADNNANQTVNVDLGTAISGPEADSDGSSPVEGVTVNHIVYSQWTYGDTPEVNFSAAEPLTDSSEYSIHFKSEGSTQDYAVAYFPVSDSFSSDSQIKYDYEAEASNPGDDELWVLLENGSKYYAHGATSTGGGEVTFDLSDKTLRDLSQNEVDDSVADEAVAIGIGQGAPTPDSGEYAVDTYIDDVEVKNSDSFSNVDELGNSTVPLAPTYSDVSVSDDMSLSTNLGVDVVSSFAINIQPASDYGLDTHVDPDFSQEDQIDPEA